MSNLEEGAYAYAVKPLKRGRYAFLLQVAWRSGQRGPSHWMAPEEAREHVVALVESNPGVGATGAWEAFFQPLRDAHGDGRWWARVQGWREHVDKGGEHFYATQGDEIIVECPLSIIREHPSAFRKAVAARMRSTVSPVHIFTV